MSTFIKKHKIKHFVMKSVGKADKTLDLPPEYTWKKTRFKLLDYHLKEVLKRFTKYDRTITILGEDEQFFGDLFEERAVGEYDGKFDGLQNKRYSQTLKEEYETLDEKKKSAMEILRKFYLEYGDLLGSFSMFKADLSKDLQKSLKLVIVESLEESKEGEKQKGIYEDTLLKMSILKKKLSQLKKELEKKEARTQKQKKLKKKMKSKQNEEGTIQKINETSRELEVFKKRAAICEQTTLNELTFHLNKGKNEYIYSLAKTINGFRTYHEKSLKEIKRFSETVNLDELLEQFTPTKKDLTVVKKLRTAFAPKKDCKVFGVAPEIVMKRIEEKEDIPKAVDLMVNYLMSHITTQGIFRVPGNNEKMDYLRRHLDDGQYDSIEHVDSVHTIASVFKMYIREIPNGLCDLSIFDDIHSIKDQEEYVKALASACRKIGVVRRSILYRLMKLLQSISKNSELNKMNTRNLSLIWGINIVKLDTKKDPTIMLTFGTIGHRLCDALIDYVDQIFPTAPKSIAEMQSSRKSITGNSKSRRMSWKY